MSWSLSLAAFLAPWAGMCGRPISKLGVGTKYGNSVTRPVSGYRFRR